MREKRDRGREGRREKKMPGVRVGKKGEGGKEGGKKEKSKEFSIPFLG